MSDEKISQLDAVTDVLDDDDYVLARAGASKRITGASLKADLGGSVPSLDAVLAVGASANSLGISDLADPSLSQDAATKAYVDASVGALNLLDVLSVGADANSLPITNLGDPTDAQDAATKHYVDTVGSEGWANIAFGFAGSISIGGDVQWNLGADEGGATRQTAFIGPETATAGEHVAILIRRFGPSGTLTLSDGQLTVSNGAGTEKVVVQYPGTPFDLPVGITALEGLDFWGAAAVEQIGSDLSYDATTGLVTSAAGGQYFICVNLFANLT